MKQYKHKITKNIVDWDSQRNGYAFGNGYVLPKVIVENSNDWEEIIKKDYEILSFKQNNGMVDLWIRDKTTIQEKWSRCGQYTTPYTTQEILSNPLYSIYSIKRLSDGEIFTIGDKVDIGYINKTISKITKFSIESNGDLYFQYEASQPLQILRPIKVLTKVKQPLFITEDGVDIHIGDKYFELIVPGFHNEMCVWNILPYEGRGNLIYDQEGNRKNFRLWFSTEEKTQEYIDLHKPKYSLNDIAKVLNSFDHRVNNYGDENYISVAKRELKNLNK